MRNTFSGSLCFIYGYKTEMCCGLLLASNECKKIYKLPIDTAILHMALSFIIAITVPYVWTLPILSSFPQFFFPKIYSLHLVQLGTKIYSIVG